MILDQREKHATEDVTGETDEGWYLWFRLDTVSVTGAQMWMRGLWGAGERPCPKHGAQKSEVLRQRCLLSALHEVRDDAANGTKRHKPVNLQEW